MQRGEPDFKRISELISADVSLAAALLKVANSPVFGLGRRVRNIPDALLILGLKMTVETIAGIALQNIFSDVPSLERFWDSSAKVAHISRWLTRQLKASVSVHPDDAFTFGIFRDCGIPVIMRPFPEYVEVLQRANAEQVRPFTEVEDEALTINHAVFGSELAEEWCLPEETMLAIRMHHDHGALALSASHTLPQAARELIAIAQLAEYMVQLKTGKSKTSEWSKMGSATLLLLGLDDAALRAIEEDATQIM